MKAEIKMSNTLKSSLHQSSEDYLEAILQLSTINSEVRSIDVANMLKVSRPSVNKAIGILKEKKLVTQELYGSIELTALGTEYATEIFHRHNIIKNFLTEVLKVEPETADSDACKMEHTISRETMIKLIQYLDNIMLKND